MDNLIDFLRIALAAILPLAVLPALAASRRANAPWPDLAAIAFLRTALFFTLIGLFMGRWQLYRPGMVTVLAIAWLLASLLLSSRKGWLYNPESWAKGYGRMLRLLEERARLKDRLSGTLEITQAHLLLAILIAAVLLRFLPSALENLRFSAPDGYASALSLGALLNGAPWTRDAFAALLAPAAVFSGLDAATVVRLSVPIAYLLFLCAVAYTASAFAKSAWTPILAVLLVWLYSKGPGIEAATATAGALWAAIALTASAGAARLSLGYPVCGLVLAWLLAPSFPELFAVALLAILAALLFDGYLALAPAPARQLGMAAVVVIGALSLAAPLPTAAADGPLQYESAARAADRIAREFPRNSWLIVSPMHEAAFTFGRGWHMELPPFLEQFPASRIAASTFRFPFEVNDVFLFVEKRPLPQSAELAVPGNGINSFYYSTNPGRASMAFRAAAVAAAYTSAHPDASVYFEDEQLIVYRFPR